MKILTVAQMIEAERQADAAGISYAQMMENAGKLTAEALIQRGSVAGKTITILVGAGNNGGDGLVAARYLARSGANVACYLFRPRYPEQDANFAQLAEAGVTTFVMADDMGLRLLRHRLLVSDVVIDALLGTGVSRPIQGEMAPLLRRTKRALAERQAILAEQSGSKLRAIAGIQPAPSPKPFVVAVDCPSGLNLNSGELDPLAIPADVTVTFAAPKRGHFRFPGASACGDIVVADIGVPPELPALAAISLELMTADKAQAMAPPRPIDGHKGTFGKSLICAGQAAYWGAPILAGLGAIRAGTGLAAMAVPATIRPVVAAKLPGATYPPVPDEETLGATAGGWLQNDPALQDVAAMLVGPGLGDAPELMAWLFEQERLPSLIIDADGLNLLAQEDNWHEKLPANSILTPHPGEMGRLCGMKTSQVVTADRVALAQQKAAAWGHTLLLKGAYSVVAAPDGRTMMMPFANATLGVAGSGDVLAGVIVALLGQGMPAFEAAAFGAYWHGAAGEWLRKERGEVGVKPEEIADALPIIRQMWLAA